MAQLNKAELASENNNSFPNNNAGLITPSALRTFNGDMIDSTVNQGTYNTDSASFSGSIAQLQAFSSSLDATFATDAQLTALSTSVAVTNASQDSQIAALQQFSSSLDATFATDAQLTALSTSIAVTDAGQDSKINSLINATGSFITESETGSMSVASASFATTASFALNATSINTGSFATTGSNIFIGDQKITGSVRVDGDLILDDDGGTTSFLLNQKFTTEFLGSNLRWQEAAKKVTWEVFEKEVQLGFSGYSSSYDNGLIIDLKSDGTTFSDYNPSFVNQSWLRVLPNDGSNPAPQMTRGLGVTGSVNITGNITATSASFQYVQTIYETSSTQYSSGSNQFGDASGDVQTLWGTVDIKSGPLVVSSSAQILNNLGITGSLNVNGNTAFGNEGADTHIFSGSVRVDGEIYRLGEQVATQGPNNFVGDQKITGSLRVDGDFFLDDDGGTTQFLMNAKYFTEFKGIATRWQENNKTASVDMGEGNIALLYYAYGTGYDNGFHTDIDSSGTTFSDYNTSYSKQPWLKILPNPNTNPAPQFVRGLGVTGSVNINGNTTITGSLDVNGNNVISLINNLTNKSGSWDSRATTSSNNFFGNQFISGAIFQSSSTANEFTRVQIANSNKAFFGEANTLLSLVGDSQGIFDFYADGGNYDTLNVVVNQNGGTTFRDWTGAAYNNWLVIPTNTGTNPAPQFKRGLGITGSMAISGSTTLSGSLFIASGSNLPNGVTQRVLTYDSASGQVKQASVADVLAQNLDSAEFWSTTTQSGSAGVSGSIQFNNSGSVAGVSVVNNSQITLSQAGTYNIQFSAQIETSAGADTVYIWFKKNGTNITASASKAVLANNTAQVITVNLFDEGVANDYYELGYQTTNGNATILAEAASGNIPAIPSVILTIQQIR